VLKFAAADLDPPAQYDLMLQNVHEGEGTVFELDVIRVITTGTASSIVRTGSDSVSVSGPGTTLGVGSNINSYGEDLPGVVDAAGMSAPSPLMSWLTLTMVVLLSWRSLAR